MAKRVAFKHSFEKLFHDYDVARAEAKDTEAKLKGIGAAIKEQLGETEEVDTPTYLTTYRYDKDKEVTRFDQQKFAEKDPKGYEWYLQTIEKAAVVAKKYTVTTTERGARKLLVTRKEQD